MNFNCYSCQTYQKSSPLEIRSVLSVHCSYLLPHFPVLHHYRALMNALGCFTIPKQLSVIPAARCQFELWQAWKQLGKDQLWIYLQAGPRGKIKEFLYVFTCFEILIQTYLVLIKRNRSHGLHFFLSHSLFSSLCPMKLAPVFVFHVSGWYMATEKLFLQTVGGVFGQSFIGKIINSKRSEDSSHYALYLWLMGKVRVILTRTNLGSSWFSQLIVSNS